MTATVDTIEAMALTPQALAELFGGDLEGAVNGEKPLGEVVSDSRRVRPGSVFVALPGEHDDGHGHVREATEAGAAMAVVDRSWVPPVRRPDLLLRVDGTAVALRQACSRRLQQLGCTVVGITGSVGKTTVKEMCAHVLQGHGRVARTPGNLNTWTGVPLAVLNLDAPVDIFIAELAMSARGEIRDLAGFTRPAVAVVLNVGLAHVGLLGSIDEVAAAKAELLEAMAEDGVAVLNADDPRVAAMAGGASGARPATVVWFGLECDAAFHATGIESRGFEGSAFVVHGPDGEASVELRVPGRHAVLNACAAAAVSAQFGVGTREVAQRLSTFQVPDQRGRVVPGQPGVLIYDDCYNSSPTSLSAALQVLAESGARRRVAIVGDMLELGDQAEGEHHAAGRRIAAAATDLIAVGEHAAALRAGALDAGMTADSIAIASDAGHASALAHDVAAPGPCSRGAPSWDSGRRVPEVAVLVKGSRGVGLERVVAALTR